MSEKKTREQMAAELMEQVQSGQNNLHLTEVAKPGVYEPVHVEDTPAIE